jgi:hypothetical protein
MLFGHMGGLPNLLQIIGIFRPQYGNTPIRTGLYISFLPACLKTLHRPINDTNLSQELCISALRSWSSYIFQDPRLRRFTAQETKDFFESREGRLLHVRWSNLLRNTVKDRPAISDRPSPSLPKVHPIVRVLPTRAPNDRKRRVFVEECWSVFFWPRLLQKKEAREEVEEYGEEDLGENNFLIKKYEWPTAEEVAPPHRQDLEDFPVIDPNRPRRIYVKQKPGSREEQKIPPSLLCEDIFCPLGGDQPCSNLKLSKRRNVYKDERDEDGEDFLTIMGGPPPTQAISSRPQPWIPSFSYELCRVALRESRPLAPAIASMEGPFQSSLKHVQAPQRSNDGSIKCEYFVIPTSFHLVHVLPAANSRSDGGGLSQPLGKDLTSVSGSVNPPQPPPKERKSHGQGQKPSCRRPRASRSRSPRRNMYPKSRSERRSPARDSRTHPSHRGPRTMGPTRHPQRSSPDPPRGRQQHRAQEATTDGLKSLWQARGISLSPSHPLLAGRATSLEREHTPKQVPVRDPSQSGETSRDVTMVDAPESQPLDDAMDISQPIAASSPAAHFPSGSPSGIGVSTPPIPFAAASASVLEPHPTAHTLPTAPSVPVPGFWMQHDLVAICEGRLRASAFAAHRLNVLSAPATQSDRLVAAKLRHTKLGVHLTCYPLRFENVFLPSQSPLSVIDTFLSFTPVCFGEVILISVYIEGDRSATIDVGFRFADEALLTWQKDGFQHAGHYWRIAPITSVRGHCYVVRPRGFAPRSRPDRIRRLRSALELESHIQACAMTDPIIDVVSAQMREVLNQLNTFDLESASVSSSGSYKQLDNEELGKIQPWARPSDWTIMPGGSMMTWMKTWTVPCKIMPAFTSRRVQRAPVEATGTTLVADADPTSSRVVGATDGDILHQAYRTIRHTARQKIDCWHTPGGEVQLPPLPANPAPGHRGARDWNEVCARIWQWYEDSLVVIRSAYTASQLGLSSEAGPNLSKLSRISTVGQRETTVRRMSYAALTEAFSPQDRLHPLSGKALANVMARIGTLP